MKMIDLLVQMQEKDLKKFEAYKFVQERVDLYFDENSKNIIRVDAEHNQSARTLSGLLITYSTVVIGLVTLIVGQPKLLASLNGYQKGFLITGVILLFMSLLAGAFEIWESMQHFKKISGLYARANKEAPIPTMEDIKDLHSFRNNLFQEQSSSSSSRGLITQVCFLSLATILYLALFATIIF